MFLFFMRAGVVAPHKRSLTNEGSPPMFSLGNYYLRIISVPLLLWGPEMSYERCSLWNMVYPVNMDSVKVLLSISSSRISEYALF